MSRSTDQRPSRIPWPPIVFLIAIAAGGTLHYLVPIPWLGSPLADLLFAAGWLLILAAVFVGLMALQTLRNAGTTIRADRKTEHLVTSGPYSFSRNPIYLAFTTFVIGLGFVTGGVWFLICGILAAFATQKLAVEPEEHHLAERFGKRFRDYQKQVRRWI